MAALSSSEKRIVELVLKATGDAELKRISRELTATREAAQGTQASLTKMSSGFSNLGSNVQGFVAALGVRQIIAWTKAILDAADALDAAAEQAGIGVERYQTLKEAFRVNEIDAEKFGVGIEKLAATMSQVLAGETNKATKALDAMGISAKILSGEITTTDQLVDALAQSNDAMGDSVKFNAEMVDLFGRKLGVDFANALKNGTLATEEMKVKMSEFGVVTKEQIKTLADAQETIEQFKTHAGNAILIWSATVIDAMNEAVNASARAGASIPVSMGLIAQAAGAIFGKGPRPEDKLIADLQAQALEKRAQQARAAANRAAAAEVAAARAASAKTPKGGGGGESAASKAAAAAKKAAEDHAKLLKDLGDEFDKIAEKGAAQVKSIQDQAKALEEAADPVLAYTNAVRELDLIQQTAGLSAAAYDARLKELAATRDEAIAGMSDFGKVFDDIAKAQEDQAAHLEKVREQWGFVADAMGQATYDILSGTAKVSDAVRQMVSTILSEVARMLASKLAAKIVGMLFASSGGSGLSFQPGPIIGSAQGNVFSNGAKMFASGGIISGPTAFGMSGGIGIAGEAGPEMVAPLRRDRSGNLGVGAVAPKVTVNNYAGADVGVTQTNDGLQIDIIRRAIANDIRRGGNAVSGAIEGAYRVGRQAAAFS